MQHHILFLLFLSMQLIMDAQTNYPTGNEAYVNEKTKGYTPVKIGGGDAIYYFDGRHHVYRNGENILIPDLMNIPDGHTIDSNAMYGFGQTDSSGNTAFQWDAQSVLTQPNRFDVIHMFVSPVSATKMTYARALQHNNDSCPAYDNCYAMIDAPDSSLAYANDSIKHGFYSIGDGEELIYAGVLKENGIPQKISQQQLASTSNRSYCVETYGEGWRLPTDIEAGHYNDETGSGNGWDYGYRGDTNISGYMWTSSVFSLTSTQSNYTVKRWPVALKNGVWENCAGFIQTNNYVRCVFSANDQTMTNIYPTTQQKDYFTVYPNPFSSHIHINIKEKGDYTIEIIDVYGNTIISEKITTSIIVPGDLTGKGMYFLKLMSSEKKLCFLKKIIKE